MAAQRYDLIRSNSWGVDHPIEQGPTFTLSITVAQNLAGAAVEFTGRKSSTDEGTPIFAKSVGDGVVVTPGVESSIVCTLTDEETTALQARTKELECELGEDYALGFYNLKVTLAGETEGYLYGDFEVTPEATR
jgi:hypothetical protein